MPEPENLNLNIANSEYDREQRRLRLDEQKALQEGEAQRQKIAELAIMAEQKKDLLGQNENLTCQKEDLLARLGTKEDKCSDYRKNQLAIMAETHEREQKDLLARLDAKEGRSMNERCLSQ
jgi:hypothetical protein